jgi:hypothetical protein
MMKKLATTGLAVGLALGGSTAAFAHDNNTSVDLSTKLGTAIENGDNVSKAEFEGWAKSNDWEEADLQAWAKSESMSEDELQQWAVDNGWSKEDSSRLDLNLNANLELDNILDDDNNNWDDNDNWNHQGDDDEGILDGILRDIL